jgi:hypothetical protein
MAIDCGQIQVGLEQQKRTFGTSSRDMRETGDQDFHNKRSGLNRLQKQLSPIQSQATQFTKTNWPQDRLAANSQTKF